jgi:excisionase family DNA binding protein
MSRELLKPREVAKILAVSQSTVYRWFWEGKLSGVQIFGTSVRIFAADVEEMLTRSTFERALMHRSHDN